MSADPRKWLYQPTGWIFLVYTGLAGTAAWWMRAHPSVEWANDAVVVIPLLVLGAVGNWILSQLLWLISDRRHPGIFHGIYLALMCCGLLVVLIAAREEQYAEDVRIAERVTQAREALRRQSFERAKAALDAIAERRARMEEDPFLQYEGRVPPETLDQMRTVHREILDGIREISERYEAVLAESPTMGPESWLRLATREELEAERQRNALVYEAARGFVDYLDGLEARYKSRLDTLDLPPPADRYAAAEMARVIQGFNYSGALRIRELEVEISAVAIRAIDILLRNWDSWHFDRATSRVVFKEGNIEMAFMHQLAEAAKLVDEQIKLRRRLDRVLPLNERGEED